MQELLIKLAQLEDRFNQELGNALKRIDSLELENGQIRKQLNEANQQINQLKLQNVRLDDDQGESIRKIDVLKGKVGRLTDLLSKVRSDNSNGIQLFHTLFTWL